MRLRTNGWIFARLADEPTSEWIDDVYDGPLQWFSRVAAAFNVGGWKQAEWAVSALGGGAFEHQVEMMAIPS